MAKYKIKHTSIMHNGNLYAEGSTVELTEKQAKRLEDFVTLIPEKKSADNSTKTQNKTQTADKTTAKNKTKAETKTETQKDEKVGENNDNK